MSSNGTVSVGIFVLGARSSTGAEVVEQARLAEELGFSEFLLAERHLRHGQLLHPSPFVLVARTASTLPNCRCRDWTKCPRGAACW